MTAFVVVEMTLKDEKKREIYSAVARPSIAKHGGEILALGPAAYLHMGDNFERALIIQFPSVEAVREWYDSPEYTGVRSIRDEAFNSRVLLIG